MGGGEGSDGRMKETKKLMTSIDASLTLDSTDKEESYNTAPGQLIFNSYETRCGLLTFMMSTCWSSLSVGMTTTACSI